MIGVGISAGLSGSKRARSIQDPLPALDLDWATDRSLPAAYGPTPSFSRASTATYFTSSGVLTSAAINGPRFNHVYNGSSWVSKGLLIEEQRTNSLTYSETFSNAAWVKARTSITSGSTTSPDGSNTASKIIEDTSSSSHQKFYYQSKTLTAATYTISGYFKAAERSWVAFDITAGADIITYFDLSTGSLGSVGSGQTASIVNVGNGWYRCSVTFTGTAATWFLIFMMSDGNNSDYYTGNGSSGIYAWGAQLELGAFPTSYIPTTTAAVTRSADVCQITGGDFTSFWNASEGSVAVEFDTFMPVGSGNFPFIFEFDNGSATANRITIYPNGGSNKIDFYVSDNSAAASTISSSTFPAINTPTKIAGCFKLNDLALAVNGGAVATDISQNMPIESRLSIGSSIVYGNYYINGHIARLRYYNTRLTNSKLQELST